MQQLDALVKTGTVLQLNSVVHFLQTFYQQLNSLSLSEDRCLPVDQYLPHQRVINAKIYQQQHPLQFQQMMQFSDSLSVVVSELFPNHLLLHDKDNDNDPEISAHSLHLIRFYLTWISINLSLSLMEVMTTIMVRLGTSFADQFMKIL
jgi:hypothetical protein